MTRHRIRGLFLLGALHLAPPALGAQGSRAPEVLLRLDDIGMNHSVNLAVEQVAKTGMPFSVSLLFACPWYQEAVEILRKYPDVAVGVHLALNSEWRNYRWGPVLGKGGVPSLVDSVGYFLPSTDAFLASRYDLGEVERELSAQVERALASGLKISYVDAHMGMAEATPQLKEVEERVARKYGLGISTHFGESYYTLWGVPVAQKKSALLAHLADAKRDTVNLIEVHVAERTPEMEVIFDMNAPSQNSPEAGVVAHRKAELETMLSPELAELVRTGKIRLVTYRQLAERASAPPRTLGLVNGRWLIDGRFGALSRYVVDGVLRDRAPSPPDATLDLQGGFVVPPFGEAHNHNVESSSRVDALIARYLHDGVFYVENPNVLPRSRAALAGKVGTPTGVDVSFANGGLTGPGGHPVEIVQRNLARGNWTAADGEGAFYWEIADAADLARKWPAIVAQRPDLLKIYLLYSDQYARRLADTSTIGWRGLNPALLPEIVRRAHAASLRVAAHIETAADFRSAVAAGVDQVAHMPGFRGDEHVHLADPAPYLLTDADAREAARRGTVVVTTLGGAAELDASGPDSLTRRALDALHRRNLATLQRSGVRLAVGSDSYRDDSKGEVRYLHGLGVFTDSALVRLWSHDTPRAIFPGRTIGRLAAGDEASFLVLACDPLVRFACTDSIRLRMKDGRVLPAAP